MTKSIYVPRDSVFCVLCAILLTSAATAQMLTVSRPEQNVQSVNVGANVAFTVDAASQSGAVEYHWQYSVGGATFANLQDGDFSGRVSGSQTATLQINNAQESDSARFRCLAKDPATVINPTNSGPAYLTVSTDLPFQITPPTGPSAPLDQGMNAILEVEITGQSGTLGGVWQFLSDTTGGTFVSLQDGLQSSQSTITGSTQTVLQIENAQPGDTGRYRYVVGDTVGASTNAYNSGPLRLTVIPVTVPKFTIAPLSPANGSVLQGGSVTTVITANSVNGFSGTVNLTAATPSGITPTFAPSSLTLPDANTSTLTLTADSMANIDTPTITITGTDASGNTRDAAFSLTVSLSAANSGGTKPVIQIPPRDTTAISASGGIAESAVFKLQATGSGNLTYVWSHAGNTLHDSSQCATLRQGQSVPPPAGSLLCGTGSPTLVIFNPQSADAGAYTCTVKDGFGNPSTTRPVQLTLITRADEDGNQDNPPDPNDLDAGNPDPQLQEIFALISHQAQVATDWQSLATWDPVTNPYSNGDNKAVVAAVVGLIYGPQVIIQSPKYTGGVARMVDYRCWLLNYLNQQNGVGGNETARSRPFQGTEFGSFDYTGYVDTAITEVVNWAGPSSAAVELQTIPLQGCSMTDPSTLAMAAQTYLKSAVGIYALMAGPGPQGNFVAVTGPTYLTPSGSKKIPKNNVPIPGTNPQQYMSMNFSVDRNKSPLGPLKSPAIALAGQRSEPGFWAGGDFRAPILCLALGLSCDTTGLQKGQYQLLEGSWQKLVNSDYTVGEQGNGPIAGVLTSLLSSSDSTSLRGFINGTSTDLSAITNLTSGVKVNTGIEFLVWNNGVRASCMDSGNSNNDRGAAIATVYWPNGHFFTTEGNEFDFLYWINQNSTLADGFKICKFNTSVNPLELDAYQLDGKTIGAKIFLPPQSQLLYDRVLDDQTSGLHTPGKTADVAASPAGAVYNSGQSVTLSSASPNATIYYTTDGSLPTYSSAVYTGPISFTTSSTIDAIASSPGLSDSAQLSTTYYLKASTPALNPAAGIYSGTQAVTLSDASPGATIYYTTDGSTPTTSSPVYGGPISVNQSQTINAMAAAPGLYNSDIGSAAYDIMPTIASISPATGSTGGGTVVTITGSGFVPGATVTFAGAPASGVTVVSPTQITLTTPAYATEQAVTVVETNPNGQAAGVANGFSYFVPVIYVGWVKPSGVTWGPANTLTVDGGALRGSGTVQTVWRDVTLNGPWNTIAAQSTPDGGGSWANTIPSSNYCHSYAVYANYLNVSSPVFSYVGVGSPYCSETAYVNWIEPPSLAGFGPAGSLVVQGNATGAPAGTAVTFYWSDATAGTGWNQAGPSTPDASGTWYNYVPNVIYWHQYNVYVTYDAFDTRNGQGVCAYTANGGTTWCPR